MPVKLRLVRIGTKKKPFFRIVAADSRSPRNGRFIEIVGQYHPISKPPLFQVTEERLYYWLQKGAQPTDTVGSLFKQTGLWNKWQKVKKGEAAETVVKTEVRQTSHKKSKKKPAQAEPSAEVQT